MNNYCYTLKETSDNDTEIMDIISAPNAQMAYEVILNTIEQLNSAHQTYSWKLSRIEHGDFAGIRSKPVLPDCCCDDDCGCDDCCDDPDCENEHCTEESDGLPF